MWALQLNIQIVCIPTTSDATHTRAGDDLRHSTYACSGHLGTQLIHVKQTSRDATDTCEADILERN